MASPHVPRGVDAHAHLFSREAPGEPGARYRPDYAARLEGWRALREAHGISHGVAVQPSFFGTDNGELLAALAADRGLRGVAVVDPAWGEDRLARLHEAGVRGLRLNLSGGGDYAAYATAAWRALYRAAARRGLHMEVFVEAGRLPEIATAFDGCEVAVVFDHFGNPGGEERAREASFAAAARMARERRLGVKLSGAYRIGAADPAACARRWIAVAGEGASVWGSDWPWTRHEEGRDYAELLAALGRWVGEERAPRVLWDNAAALYGFTD